MLSCEKWAHRIDTEFLNQHVARVVPQILWLWSDACAVNEKIQRLVSVVLSRCFDSCFVEDVDFVDLSGDLGKSRLHF